MCVEGDVEDIVECGDCVFEWGGCGGGVEVGGANRRRRDEERARGDDDVRVWCVVEYVYVFDVG